MVHGSAAADVACPELAAAARRREMRRGPDPHRDPREDSEVIHLIMNNLEATAHSLYMHGMYFGDINYADCSWCCIHIMHT